MDPNTQNPVNPMMPAADPNAGVVTPQPEPTMPVTPPAMPVEPAMPMTPDPVAPVAPVDPMAAPEPQVPAADPMMPVAPTEGTGDAGSGMPPTTPPTTI